MTISVPPHPFFGGWGGGGFGGGDGRLVPTDQEETMCLAG